MNFSAPPTLDYDPRLKEPQTIKAGSTVIIQVNLTGTPPLNVTWTKDGRPLVGTNMSLESADRYTILTMRQTSKADEGVYRIVAENLAGKASADFKIVVKGRESL